MQPLEQPLTCTVALPVIRAILIHKCLAVSAMVDVSTRTGKAVAEDAGTHGANDLVDKIRQIPVVEGTGLLGPFGQVDSPPHTLRAGFGAPHFVSVLLCGPRSAPRRAYRDNNRY